MKTFLLNEMMEKKLLLVGEEAIKSFYKYPLGFLFENYHKLSEKFYTYVQEQPPNEQEREYDVYYDSWLFLYSKLSCNKKDTFHYNKVMNNKSFYGAFSAKQNALPELRATAVSAICATFENELTTLKDAADYICLLEELNQKENCFYFMTDSENRLVKKFEMAEERLHVFETVNMRPLLYSFSLSVMALLCAYLSLKKKKYLEFAHKYAEKIMQNDFQNDYCGKSLIATSLLYYFSKKQKYLSFSQKLADYIQLIQKTDDGYFHNGKKLTKDRLSEYLIGLIFFENAQKKKLPSLITDYFKFQKKENS